LDNAMAEAIICRLCGEVISPHGHICPGDIPPIIRGFITQLTAPETVALIKAGGNRRLDLTLHANGGKAVLSPEIRFSGEGG